MDCLCLFFDGKISRTRLINEGSRITKMFKVSLTESNIERCLMENCDADFKEIGGKFVGHFSCEVQIKVSTAWGVSAFYRMSKFRPVWKIYQFQFPGLHTFL